MTEDQKQAYLEEMRAGLRWWRWDWSGPFYVTLTEWQRDGEYAKPSGRAGKMFAPKFFVLHIIGKIRKWRRVKRIKMPAATLIERR